MDMLNKIKISNEDIKELVYIFENEDNQKMDVHINDTMVSSKVYIESLEKESKLYFYMYKNEVVIQVIFVSNSRRGIGTKLIKKCAELGKSKGVNRLRIQSVLTEEMFNLCEKLGLVKDETTGLSDYVGDYIGSIDNILRA